LRRKTPHKSSKLMKVQLPIKKLIKKKRKKVKKRGQIQITHLQVKTPMKMMDWLAAVTSLK
jgi:hypothetical protein